MHTFDWSQQCLTKCPEVYVCVVTCGRYATKVGGMVELHPKWAPEACKGQVLKGVLDANLLEVPPNSVSSMFMRKSLSTTLFKT